MSKAIIFQNVGKQYRLGRVGTGTLQHDLNRWWQTTIMGKEDPYLKIGDVNDRATKGNSDYVWALKDINFSVEQGDVVGIIGKNGAGKSTLLKLLSHITSPSTGTIRYEGRIASLLEVGTGFHPELTARENIYMNGSIMGMTKHEIDRKLDEIVDFAGVERYLDTPVKRFSSGMTVRLGFAVAAFLEPEILVVDEVLAVGDAEFQKKAIGKMGEVASGGRTVLFVSHNMDSVRSLCKSGVVLKNGMVEYIGNCNDAVDYYLESSIDQSQVPIAEMTREPGTTDIAHITNLVYLNPDTDERTFPYCGRSVKIRIYFDVKNNSGMTFNNCFISVGINDNRNLQIMSFASYLKYALFDMTVGHHYADLVIPRLPLTPGMYRLSILININKTTSDLIKSKIPLEVLDDDFFHEGGRSMSSMAPHITGHIVLAEHSWSVDGKELSF